jgi:hypothetical protein
MKNKNTLFMLLTKKVPGEQIFWDRQWMGGELYWMIADCSDTNDGRASVDTANVTYCGLERAIREFKKAKRKWAKKTEGFTGLLPAVEKPESEKPESITLEQIGQWIEIEIRKPRIAQPISMSLEFKKRFDAYFNPGK